MSTLTLHVLTIDTGSSDLTSLHLSEADAQTTLHAYVAEHWDTVAGNGEQIPTAQHEAIAAYFEDNDREGATIAPAPAPAGVALA